MTATYLGSIRTGLLAFLAIGFVLLLPLAAVHHRRYGRLEPRRALVLYAFLAYATVAFSLVFLPFPDPATVCGAGQDSTQFVPFQFLTDMRAELAKHGRSGFVAGLTSKSVLSFVFNVALFAPLGVFLRRCFGRGLATTAAAGFGVSLAFELTQVTGNWGVYQCAYRLFDVDDLIANTGGTLLGFALAPLVVVLPRLVPEVPVYAHAVPVGRRLGALAVDLVLSGVFFLGTGAGGWDLRGTQGAHRTRQGRGARRPGGRRLAAGALGQARPAGLAGAAVRYPERAGAAASGGARRAGAGTRGDP